MTLAEGMALGLLAVPYSWVGIARPDAGFVLRCYGLLANRNMEVSLATDRVLLRVAGNFDTDQAQFTSPYTLVKGPLTPQYNNDATLLERDDGRTYLNTRGHGLWQAEIDLETGNLAARSRSSSTRNSPVGPSG